MTIKAEIGQILGALGVAYRRQARRIQGRPLDWRKSRRRTRGRGAKR